MDKKSLLELAEKYISIGLVNWEMTNTPREKLVQVYINLLELKAFWTIVKSLDSICGTKFVFKYR